MSAARLLLVCALLTAPAGAAAAEVQARALAGRALSDVLRDLQRRGVKVVFSSEVVRPSMRVEVEPRSTDDRLLLDELLRPHGLEIRSAARGTLLVVRMPAPVSRPAETRREPAAGIQGLVIDARSAAPLPGVLVRLTGHARETHSDAEGRFEFAGLSRGTYRLFVSVVGYALAEPEVTLTADAPLEVTVVLSDGAGTYTDAVHVTGDRFRGGAATVPSAVALSGTDVRELRGVLTDDPLRALHALPGVIAASDLRSEFSVRGSDFRHVGLLIDGIATGWPVHAARGDWGGGSVGLLNADLIDTTILTTGAHPQDRPARSGGWLGFTLREGSRSRTQAHASLSMTSASVITEGPLGSGSHGSWLLGGRQSYLQWILNRTGADGTSFAFGDLHGKLVVDVTPRQQLQLTLVAGRSLLDQSRVDPDPNLVTRGSAGTTLVAGAWRTIVGNRTVVTQRFAYVGERFTNDGATLAPLADGFQRDSIYRADATVTVGPATTLHGGTQAQRQSAHQSFERFIGFSDGDRTRRTELVEGKRTVSSIYARGSRTLWNAVTLDGGVLLARAADSGFSPWVNARWTLGQWTVRAGAGSSRQLPDLDQAASSFGGPHLRAERSRYADVAVERNWRGDTRLQVGVYRRRETDVLQLAADGFYSAGGKLQMPSLAPTWQNGLAVRASGIEVLAQRRSAAGLNGWISYMYSRTRYADMRTGETFDADFDQPHAFTAYAQARLSPVIAVSGKLRVASNFPIPGYLAPGPGNVRIGAERNLIRLPAYARLDLRANRLFNLESRRLTLFAELVNVLGRQNLAASCACTGWTDAPRVSSAGQVDAITQRMFPFLPTVGLVIDF